MEDDATKSGPSAEQDAMAYENGNGNGKAGFSVLLNWVSTIVAIFGAGYAIIQQANFPASIARLDTRISGDELRMEGSFHEMEVLDTQKNLNMSNIASIQAQVTSIVADLDRRTHNRDQSEDQLRKELSEVIQDQKLSQRERIAIVNEVIDRINKDEQRIEALSNSVQRVRTWR